MRDPIELEHELQNVLVGGLEATKVVIAEYDPTWPERFESERALLAEALGDLPRRIEHIGSTSVPGLAAKPLVDILVTLDDVRDEARYRPAIEGLGFELRVDEPEHKAFRRPDRTVNLHVWRDDDLEVAKYITFRDRLRSHPEDRILYETKKRELAEREWRDVNFYADAKSEVIEAILERARAADR